MWRWGQTHLEELIYSIDKGEQCAFLPNQLRSAMIAGEDPPLAPHRLIHTHEPQGSEAAQLLCPTTLSAGGEQAGHSGGGPNRGSEEERRKGTIKGSLRATGNPEIGNI